MKRRLLYLLLVLVAVLCAAWNLAKGSFSGVFSAAVAFPFEQIGMGLRLLSLSGRIGNALALTLYVLLCLLPVLFLLKNGNKRKPRAEDALLVLLSAALFAALYYMSNPAFIGKIFMGGGAAGLAAGKAVLGGTLWSILCGYFILRVLRLSFESGSEKLQGYLGAVLCVLAFLFVWAVFGGCFGELLLSFSALREGNAGFDSGLGATYVFLVLRFFVDALPYLLDAVTVFLALDLLAAMRADRYSEKTEMLAERLSRWCGKALAAVVVSGVSLNLLQLLFARTLRTIDSSLSVPVLSVLFVLAVLLFARQISENRSLKGENDLFI